MPDFDKNAAYIWACYLVGGLTIAALCLHAWLAARAARRQLERFGGDKDEGQA